MTNVIILKPDMTYINKSIKTKQNYAIIDKNNKPSFQYGRGLFRERRKILDKWLKPWKRAQDLLLWFEGAPKCWAIDPRDFEKFEFSIWEQSEIVEYVEKKRAQAGLKQQLMSGWALYLMIGLLVANLLFTLRMSGFF
jgi:hypothetical protein